MGFVVFNGEFLPRGLVHIDGGIKRHNFNGTQIHIVFVFILLYGFGFQ